jgi:hypothetical protein
MMSGRFGVAQNRIYHKPEHNSVYGNPEPYLFWFGIILVLGKSQYPNKQKKSVWLLIIGYCT